ncbi:sel1 repeat family protein [Zooshikella marina]|uniref:tetratricopeptide repeat protein n=1 Tax=Zooshikella ganghwensis TaxID=202772 RepID=UPI001BAECAA0|nr:tetratricopeptide repeat protein [Zooshikella ganghwensis]MBU2708444.1 sel1 repeat family protein [Zooshikella ganghwensis]
MTSQHQFTFNQAQKAYDNNELEQTIHLLTPLGQQGVLKACRLLALIYSMEVDNHADTTCAHDWQQSFIHALKHAARNGDTNALFELATYYQQGVFVVQDERKAQYLFLKAAVNGHRQAQFKLAVLYKQGECGLPMDHGAYRHWLRLAAHRAHPEAMYLHGVALMHEKRKAEGTQFIRHANQKGFWLAEAYIKAIDENRSPVATCK